MTYFNRSNQYRLGRLVAQQTAAPVVETGIIPVGAPEEGDTVRYSEFTGEWTPQPDPAATAGSALVPIADSQLFGRKVASGLGDPENLSPDEASDILDLATDPFLRKSELNPVELPPWVGPFSRNVVAVALVPGSELAITPGWWLIDYTGLLDTTIQTNGGNWQINFSGGPANIEYFSGLISVMANVGDGNSTPLREVGQQITVASTRFLTNNRFSLKLIIKAIVGGNIDLRIGTEVAGQTITITTLQGVAIRQSF